MYSHTLQEHSPPSQLNNTVTVRSHANRRIKFVNAANISRTAETVLNERLADRNNWPSNLLQQSGTPWGKRGVTKPLAEKVFHYVEKHYLAGRAKSGCSQYTHNLCKNVYRRIAGRPDGYEVTKKEQKKVGACLGYLAALGVLEYVPGTGVKGAYVGYGYAVLGTTAPVLAPVKTIKGGAPKSNQKETDLGAPITGSYYREKTQRRDEKKEQKQTATAVVLTPEGVTLLTAFTDHLKGVARGRKVAAELEATAGKHARLVRLLNEIGQACGEAVTAGVTNAYGLARKTVTEAGDTGRPNDLTATETPARLLGHLLEIQADNITAVLEKETRRQGELATAGADTHGAYKTELVRDANGREYLTPVVEVAATIEAVETPLEKENARRYSKAPAAALNALASHVDGYATVQPDTATLEGIEQATAVTELTPAYLAEPWLRGRIVADAVRQAKHLGGLTGVDAERLHAVYLERRAAGNLWADTDLAVLEKELGRPLHLAECALYDLAVSVSVVAWERVEAGEPPPVSVRSVVTV